MPLSRLEQGWRDGGGQEREKGDRIMERVHREGDPVRGEVPTETEAGTQGQDGQAEETETKDCLHHSIIFLYLFPPWTVELVSYSLRARMEGSIFGATAGI